MTEHRPECPCQCTYDCGGPCICDALRACEKRIAKEWELFAHDQFDAGYDAGAKGE